MGRKIRGKKHHGAKDPEKQQQKRMEKIKMKIDNRPDQEDHQEIPKKMQFIMRAKEEMKEQRNNQKLKKKNEQQSTERKPVKSEEDGDRPEERLLDSTKHQYKEYRLPGMERPLKPIPVFKQRPGEQKRAFFYRMQHTIQGMIQQKDYEEKFGVELHRDEDGNTKILDAPKDELVEMMEEKKREKLAKKGIVLKTKEEKRAKRREREKKRRMRKKGKSMADLNVPTTEDGERAPATDFNQFSDRISFGDVVHAPPTIRFGNNKKKINPEERKPGCRDLLLKDQLKNGAGGGNVGKNRAKLAAKKKIRKTLDGPTGHDGKGAGSRGTALPRNESGQG